MNNSTYQKNINTIIEYLENFKYQDNFLKKMNKKNHPIELRRIIREINKEIDELTKYTKELDDYYGNDEKKGKKEKKTIKNDDIVKMEEINNNNEKKEEKIIKNNNNDKKVKIDDTVNQINKIIEDLYKNKPSKFKTQEEIENHKENVYIKINKLKNIKKSLNKDDIKQHKKIDPIIKQMEIMYNNLSELEIDN